MSRSTWSVKAGQVGSMTSRTSGRAPQTQVQRVALTGRTRELVLQSEEASGAEGSASS
ncbi:hypothetical protein [Arthrobacter sp. Leaf234]|uniref:hypothetical protein n=1 Tax=Arthrobacter sp. Leaf234 TaxID=1736303 RepID=UPI000AB945F6|nr:hypothetical protein [Arthrobacter sp. Leaf234]